MELNQPSTFVFVASFIFIIFILVRSKPSKPTSNIPPGPWKLPLIGNLHNLMGALPHHALHRLALKHGPLMHLQLGEISAVVVSSPEVAKQVMKTHDLNFASRPSIASVEILSHGYLDIVFAPYGEYWRRVKKIFAFELLTHKRVQSFRFIREGVLTRLMKWIASNEGSPVNLTAKIHSSTFEIVSQCALGDVIKEKDSLLSIIIGIFELSSGFDLADVFPSIGLLHKFSKSRQKLLKYRDEIDIILEKIIQEHRVANSSTTIHERKRHEYFVDTLLKLQEEGTDLSTDSIKALIMDVLVPGSETSSTTSIWVMAEMMKNPEILDKAQQEVRQVFDPKGYVDESDVEQLKYLTCVIKETLRLHPPTPLLVPRKCTQTCEINGYEIPAETKVIVNAWAINNDPSYWKNPYQFQPERFLDNKVNYEGNSFEYIPFGAGRRICPGIAFGVANVQLSVAMLLYNFNWTLPTGLTSEEMDMTEGFGITAARKKPLYIVPMLKRAIPNFIE